MDITAIGILLCAIGQCLSLFAGDMLNNVQTFNKQGTSSKINSNTDFTSYSSSIRPHTSFHLPLRKRFIFNKLFYANKDNHKDVASPKQMFVYPAILSVTKGLLDIIHEIIRQRQLAEIVRDANDKFKVDSYVQQARNKQTQEIVSDGTDVPNGHGSAFDKNSLTSSPNTEVNEFPVHQNPENDFLFVSKHADTAFENTPGNVFDSDHEGPANENQDEDSTDNEFDNTNALLNNIHMNGDDKYFPGIQYHPFTAVDPFQGIGHQQQPDLLSGSVPNDAPPNYDSFYQNDNFNMPPSLIDLESRLEGNRKIDIPTSVDSDYPDTSYDVFEPAMPIFQPGQLPSIPWYGNGVNFPDIESTAKTSFPDLAYVDPFGISSEAVFRDDLPLCPGIEGKTCSTDNDCPCYSTLTCIKGHCGAIPATEVFSPIDADGGFWHSGPVEHEGIV